MNIRGPSEFSEWLSSVGLSHRDNVFTQLFNCIHNFRAACSCYKKEDKMKMYDTCKKLYRDAIMHVVPKLKGELLSKTQERSINFYDENGTLLRIVSR